MIIWLVLILIGQFLLTSLAGSLRYLNFSQLKKHFKPDEYTALVEQLKNRDEVETLCWTFATIAALFFLGYLSMSFSLDISEFLFLAIFLSIFIHILPLLMIAPWAERFLIELMPLYRVVESIPFAVFFMLLVRRMSFRLAGETEEENLSMEMSHLIMEGEAEGTVGEAETVMIQKVIELKHTAVREAMTPRANLIFLQEGTAVREAMALADKHGLSRLPIYDSGKDEIKGVFFVRDALHLVVEEQQMDHLTADKLMRQVPVVPETRSIGSLLRTMSNSRNQMLIVLDEYGGLSGVITLEDILEEIVGEIRDEYADEDLAIEELKPGVWEVQGGVHIEEVQEQVGMVIPENPAYETIAGYLLSRAQRIPRRGEAFECDGYRLTVLRATPRRIERLKLELIS